MRNFVEVSGVLENRLWGYYSLPGLEGIVPGVEIAPIATVNQDGFFASRVSFSTISGTYVESGAHILERGLLLDSYKLEDFIRPCSIIRLPEQNPRSLIRKSVLEQYAVETNPGDALIIDTGWGKQWNKQGYVLNCPNFAPDAIEWVIDRQPSIFGVDIPCIEGSWSEDNEEEKGGLLGVLFNQGALLVAPLINLWDVPRDTGILYCMPLQLAGTSGAPARVFIEIEKNT